MAKADSRLHLVATGDSFFGATTWACGDETEDSRGHLFGMGEINCRKCIGSPLYREICEEEGEVTAPSVQRSFSG